MPRGSGALEGHHLGSGWWDLPVEQSPWTLEGRRLEVGWRGLAEGGRWPQGGWTEAVLFQVDKRVGLSSPGLGGEVGERLQVQTW